VAWDFFLVPGADMKIPAVVGTCLIVFASPLHAQLTGSCYETLLHNVNLVEGETEGGDVEVLVCTKVGRGYEVRYGRTCPAASLSNMAYTGVVIDPNSGQFGTCQLQLSGCDASVEQFFPRAYASNAEFNSDKRDIQTLCSELPLDGARICQ
jgi:hypothetical protein